MKTTARKGKKLAPRQILSGKGPVSCLAILDFSGLRKRYDNKEPNDVRKCCSKLGWKWILGIMGVVAGIAYGLAALVYAYAQAPGIPGICELVLQIIMVAFVALVLGILGFAVGWGADWVAKKKST